MIAALDARATLDTLCRESAAIECLIEDAVERLESIGVAYRHVTEAWRFDHAEPLPITAAQFRTEVSRERRQRDFELGFDEGDMGEWSADLALSDAHQGL